MNERETALPLTDALTAEELAFLRSETAAEHYVGGAHHLWNARLLATLDAARAGDGLLREALTNLDFDYVEVHVGPESRRFNPDQFAEWLFQRAYAALFQPFGEVDSALRATDTGEPER